MTANQLVEVYLSRQWSFGGPQEKAFAEEFARSHGANYGVFMANGTVTLQCALEAYGIGEGDEVIVPALTWVATAMAPLYAGATPVFCDIDENTLCLDATKLEQAITPRTRAIIPVHLYGSTADLDAIMALAKKHDLIVIEDCAHAHGGKWNGRGLGSIGDVGSFSFQESKTLASGEGGICITNDEDIAERLYRAKHIGYGQGVGRGKASAGPPADLRCHNFRATEFQAVILRAQLAQLDERIARYNRGAATLETRLGGVKNLGVQARGRCAEPQSYYAFAVTFGEAFADVPILSIVEALQAEGFPVNGNYGPVYAHTLFNVDSQKYVMPDGGCPVADAVCARTVTFLHQWLESDETTLHTIADIFEKVAGNADAFRPGDSP